MDDIGALLDAAESDQATLTHDELLRSHIESFGGQLIETTGDGALATFNGSARAIYCACGIRDAAASLGLSIRADLHTGEIELMNDGIGGLAVHIGARVAALAEADEVLVSAAGPPAGCRIGDPVYPARDPRAERRSGPMGRVQRRGGRLRRNDRSRSFPTTTCTRGSRDTREAGQTWGILSSRPT